MIDGINLPLIMLAALVAVMSPGPATLGIAGTSMASGRKMGLALASGITTGSLMWSTAAALGLGAIMQANVWLFEIVRYGGAAYLLYLAYKSARSAISPSTAKLAGLDVKTVRGAYARGLALHLTNPKAVLFFGSLFAIGVPPDAPLSALAIVIAAIAIQSAVMFHLYAVIFSSRPVANFYLRAKRWMDGVFALAFGAVGLRILTAKLA
ncbi:LysE family translocator [Ahrensia sp. R2A130]|uniref:LysE family translocator n=1 Tax=Ahrensia sp. R2A130 TaxID=744979 RepID=UPI0001E0F0A8|nr:LysE family transporter [Ahrensia sp. R2A130]EFL89911.1 lysine exporter protein LysE/YggA [Ahrensia sp. R2A130]